MADNNALTQPSGGFWPFGKIVVATPGTPVQLTTNVGSQTNTKQFGVTKRIRQIIFQCDPGSGGNGWAMHQQNPRTNTNKVLVIVYNNGQQYSLPHGNMLNAVLVPPDEIWIDGDAPNTIVYAVGIYG